MTSETTYIQASPYSPTKMAALLATMNPYMWHRRRTTTAKPAAATPATGDPRPRTPAPPQWLVLTAPPPRPVVQKPACITADIESLVRSPSLSRRFDSLVGVLEERSPGHAGAGVASCGVCGRRVLPGSVCPGVRADGWLRLN